MGASQMPSQQSELSVPLQSLPDQAAMHAPQSPSSLVEDEEASSHNGNEYRDHELRFAHRKSSGTNILPSVDRGILKRRYGPDRDEIDTSSSLMLSSDAMDQSYFTQYRHAIVNSNGVGTPTGNYPYLSRISSNKSTSDFNSFDAHQSTESVYQFGIPSSPPIISQDFHTDNILDSERSMDGAVPGIPSSPPLFAASQTTVKAFERPQLTKNIDPISRNATLLADNDDIDFSRLKRQKLPEGFRPHAPQQSLTSSATTLGTNEEFAIDRNGKVYGVFLEDSKLPSNYKLTLFDDPSFFVVKNDSKVLAKASEMITRLFDNDSGNPVFNLHLDDLGLTSLPEQIVDFKDLVIYGPEGFISPVLNIHAARNQLRSVTPNLFEIKGLEMLSLRENKIARIPGYIEKAKDLKTVNFSSNKLKWLPHNILKLENLEMIRIRPNPLVEARNVTKKEEISTTEVSGSQIDTFHVKNLRYVGRLHWVDKKNDQVKAKSVLSSFKLTRNLTALSERYNSLQDMMDIDDDDEDDDNEESHHISLSQPLSPREDENQYISFETGSKEGISHVPKLTELCLRTISKYPIGKSELLNWKDRVIETVYKLTINALVHGTNGETCGVCNEIVIQPIAEVMEWWDFKDAKMMPVKRKFCCQNCVAIWQSNIEELKSRAVFEEDK